jgi:type IV secretory pathway VirB10-like protein
MAHETDHLLTRPTLPTARRLSRETCGAVALTVCGLLGVYLFVTLSARQRVRETPVPPAKPGAYDVSGTAEPDVALKLQQSYAGWNREPVLAKAPVPLPPLPAAEPFPPMFPAPTPAPVPALRPSLPPAAAPTLPPERLREPPQAPATSATAPQKKAPVRWFSGGQQHQAALAKPLFPVEKANGGPEEKDPGTSPLVHTASWARLANPALALYRTMTIHGMLTQDVNSSIPGQIQVRVTRPVMDELGQGITLIPQFSTLLGLQVGTPKAGDARLEITIDQVQLPDKTIIDLAKAKLADRGGAVGLPGDVNNHYGRVLLGAGISAVLSIGARGAAGNTTGFQPTIQQDFARDVAGSVNQSGQRVVQQQIAIPPTITTPAGTPVTIQLTENISLQHPPVVVTK